ncbi:hypothetical protein QBC39DRAFT_75868 [Podospora conica]|nr:hypothetical protein QBC39DRAFT_75868 [Schizothecium conicum]
MTDRSEPFLCSDFVLPSAVQVGRIRSQNRRAAAQESGRRQGPAPGRQDSFIGFLDSRWVWWVWPPSPRRLKAPWPRGSMAPWPRTVRVSVCVWGHELSTRTTRPAAALNWMAGWLDRGRSRTAQHPPRRACLVPSVPLLGWRARWILARCRPEWTTTTAIATETEQPVQGVPWAKLWSQGRTMALRLIGHRQKSGQERE